MDWIGMARSNYFLVKDEAAFKAWAESANLGIFTNEDGMFAIYHDEGAGWPSSRTVEDEECVEDVVVFDIEDELPEYLAEGEIAVLMEVGWEGMRYLTGYATAVAWDGRIETLNLDDIYRMAAAEFGVSTGSITRAAR